MLWVHASMNPGLRIRTLRKKKQDSDPIPDQDTTLIKLHPDQNSFNEVNICMYYYYFGRKIIKENLSFRGILDQGVATKPDPDSTFIMICISVFFPFRIGIRNPASTESGRWCYGHFANEKKELGKGNMSVNSAEWLHTISSYIHYTCPICNLF